MVIERRRVMALFIMFYYCVSMFCQLGFWLVMHYFSQLHVFCMDATHCMVTYVILMVDVGV